MRMEANLRVLRPKIIEPSGPEQRAANRNSRVDGFASIGHHTLLYQVHDPVGYKTRMDSQIAAVTQPRHNRVGNRADSDLNGHAVADIAADVARNRLLDRPNRTRLVFDQRPRRAHDMGEVLLRQRSVAIHPRRLIVDLGNHDARLLHRELGEIVCDPEAVLALFVGRAHLEEGDVARNDPVHEVFGDVRELQGNDVEDTCAGEVAPRSNRTVARDFERVGMLGPERPRIRLGAEDSRVSSLFTLLDQLFDQRKRLASALSPYNSIAGPDYFGQIEIFQSDFAGHRSLLAMKAAAQTIA